MFLMVSLRTSEDARRIVFPVGSLKVKKRRRNPASRHLTTKTVS